MNLVVKLTNTNVNLTECNLRGDVVDSSKTGRALTVDSGDGGFVGDAGVEHGHASGGRTTAGRENVADDDVLDQLGVEAWAFIGGAENSSE